MKKISALFFFSFTPIVYASPYSYKKYDPYSYQEYNKIRFEKIKTEEKEREQDPFIRDDDFPALKSSETPEADENQNDFDFTEEELDESWERVADEKNFEKPRKSNRWFYFLKTFLLTKKRK